MRRPHAWASAAVAALASVLIAAPPGHAQLLAPQPTQWTVAPPFARSNDARENISGAVCAVTQPAYRACLAVNDQKKYAQYFSVAGRTLVPGSVVRLLGEEADGDPDAEGAAYHDGYFYVVGSHGRGRHNGKLGAASFLVFRFPAALQSGKAAFGEIAPAVQTSARLRDAVRTTEPLVSFAEKPLNANGANIEGVAVDDGRLYVGFRAPTLEGRAFILSAALDGVFGGKPLAAKVHPLALGPGRGIRDLARVDGGILVLAGPAMEGQGGASVFLWNPAANALRKLADLGGIPAGAKAETLLALSQAPQQFNVLVMFDGIADGGPIEYRIPVPR